jgi:hypothetical protein
MAPHAKNRSYPRHENKEVSVRVRYVPPAASWPPLRYVVSQWRQKIRTTKKLIGFSDLHNPPDGGSKSERNREAVKEDT